jgi:hypothetical protein
MSASESPEFAALNELEAVVRHPCDELSLGRRRPQTADADRPSSGRAHDVVGEREKVVGLEAENAELERRLDATRVRVQDLLKRLRFLEEQASVHEVR